MGNDALFATPWAVLEKFFVGSSGIKVVARSYAPPLMAHENPMLKRKPFGQFRILVANS